MLRNKGLLQVGGLSKDAGKTSLVLKIIAHFSKYHKIKALKISKHQASGTVHTIKQTDGYEISQEKSRKGITDTSKMLKFGACEAYYICATDAYLKSAYDGLLSHIGQSLIVCESNSIAQFFVPDVLLICQNSNESVKPSALPLLQKAHKTIKTESINMLNIESLLEIKCNTWYLKKNMPANPK